MLKADFVQGIVAGFLLLLSAIGVGFGFIQKKKYDKERESKINGLMESAHELAKKDVDSKPIDDLIAESNKRLSARMANKSSKE